MKKLIIIFAVLAVFAVLNAGFVTSLGCSCVSGGGSCICTYNASTGTMGHCSSCGCVKVSGPATCPTGMCACVIGGSTECCTPCSFQAPCSEPQVHGTVFYNSSGTLTRLGGATITASGSKGTYTTKTDSLGNYSFGNGTKAGRTNVIPQGYYNITANHSNYGTGIIYNVWVPSPGNITCWDTTTPVLSGAYCKHNCTCNTRPFKNITVGFIDCGLRIYDGSSIIIPACEPLGTLTSPLRLSNKGNIYGIVLVDTTSTYASKARIQTTSGIKALRKL